MLIAAALLALTAAEDPAAGRPVPGGTFFYFAPPRAADHEAVIVSNEGAGPDRERRQQVIRSGSWLREGPIGAGAGAIYSDFEGAISIAFSRDQAGHYRTLAIDRHASTDTFHRYRRARTGARERVLGEDCEVWNSARVGAGSDHEIDLLSCETADGIQLWSRTVVRRTGAVIEQSRTLSFRRRAVRPDEVRPPLDLLRPLYWRALAGTPEAGAPAGHEIRLAMEGDRSAQAWRVIRRRGDWAFVATGDQGGTERTSLETPTLAIQYETEAGGRPVRLSIHPQPPRPIASGAAAFEPIPPPQSERVLGEECVWSGPSSAHGIVVTSGEHRECLTADGLPLRIFSAHHVVSADLVAIRVSRRAPSAESMLPPAAAFDWARWGVTFGD
ncbi:MAG TPA: hypothetical protein VK614_07790 [Allosphingosinicella sp.]|nr:hypothetical protein [Allosphingosinicella sp.]